MIIKNVKEGNLLSAVATSSGFSDSVYFIKKFKQFTGTSPNQYHKEFFLSNKSL